MKSYHCDSFHKRYASYLVFADPDHVRGRVRSGLKQGIDGLDAL